MTKNLDNLGEMALELVAMRVTEIAALEGGLEFVLAKIEETAKEEFGVYQAAAGPFPEWPELADATKGDRARQGFPENEPLLRTGELRDSISHERDGLEGAVGSTSDIMIWQEMGTEHIPPRPVLGPAAFRNKEVIEKLLGAAAIAGLLGTSEIQNLGYDFKTED